jgi:hypothetical protein
MESDYIFNILHQALWTSPVHAYDQFITLVASYIADAAVCNHAWHDLLELVVQKPVSLTLDQLKTQCKLPNSLLTNSETSMGVSFSEVLK